jgi:F-type H+-transporting ATPase subunit delta
MATTPAEEFRPTADVSALRIGRAYAEALLNAASKHGQGEAIGQALDSLVEDVFRADPKVEAFLASPAVPHQAKAAAIEQAFAGGGELFTNFLKVLNDHGRLELLRHIRAAYHELLDQRAHRVRVLVRTARPLADDQRQRLVQDLHDTFHLEPVLEEGLEPDLLAGMTVRVGDWLYDGSLRTQLQAIRNQIITGSSYEIQRGRNRFRIDAGD